MTFLSKNAPSVYHMPLATSVRKSMCALSSITSLKFLGTFLYVGSDSKSGFCLSTAIVKAEGSSQHGPRSRVRGHRLEHHQPPSPGSHQPSRLQTLQVACEYTAPLRTRTGASAGHPRASPNSIAHGPPRSHLPIAEVRCVAGREGHPQCAMPRAALASPCPCASRARPLLWSKRALLPRRRAASGLHGE